MSEEDFKLFDIFMKKREDNDNVCVEELCEHERVYDGVCDSCFEIIHRVHVSNDVKSHFRASFSQTSKHNRVSHFAKVMNEEGAGFSKKVLDDFEDFVWAFDRIDKGSRKNFLLNRWVLWKISERRGIKCERYKIKNAKSGEEHERLGRLIFEKLGWI